MVSSFGGEILAASTETALTDITILFLQEVKWSVQMHGRFLPYPFKDDSWPTNSSPCLPCFIIVLILIMWGY